VPELEKALMAIVAGLTWIERRSLLSRTPTAVARWTGRFAGQRIDVAVEACTGWLLCPSR
jgi:hypothetical protein